MRKIANCALGILASVLASPAAVSQERQQVVQAERFVWGIGINTAQGVEDRVEISRDDFTARAIVVTESGGIAWMGDGSEPLMRGDLKNAVKEMELSSQRMRNGGLEKRLATLDDAEKAVMKARRLLGPRGDPRAGKPVDEKDPDPFHEMVRVSGSGTVRYWSVNGLVLYNSPHQRVDQTPREAAYSAFTWAVTLIRQSPGAEDARRALDEVEKSISALRSLFWEQETKKD